MRIAGIASLAMFVGPATVVVGAITAAATAAHPVLGGVVGMAGGIGASLIAGQISKSFLDQCE